MAKQDPPSVKPVIVYAGLGVEVSGLLLGSALLGYYLDKWLATTPVFTLVLVLVGTITILLRAVRLIKKMERHDR